MINIFTDGSSKRNPGPGGWAAIVADGEKVVELGGREEHTTNNRMELTAVIEALNSIKEKEITLHTDSEYIVKGITVWVKGWQENNWRTAAKKPVLNQDLWQSLVQAVEGKDINWVVVKGHSGVEANERCDVIATTLADGDPFELYNGPKKGYEISFSAIGTFN